MTWLVATEDELSEAVAIRLLAEAGVQSEMTRLMRKNGNGYLKKRLDQCNKSAASGFKVFMLTDLDNGACAADLVQKWFGRRSRERNFLLRVAVREVEAWLMADREAFAKFIGVSVAKVSREVEVLADPKRELLTIAKSGKRRIRKALRSEAKSIAVQAPEYNDTLIKFVRSDWSTERASAQAQSLARARKRIAELANNSSPN